MAFCWPSPGSPTYAFSPKPRPSLRGGLSVRFTDEDAKASNREELAQGGARPPPTPRERTGRDCPYWSVVRKLEAARLSETPQPGGGGGAVSGPPPPPQRPTPSSPGPESSSGYVAKGN